MATFVLIHGAWHGGWCWARVVAHLEAAGHRALAPDLPGHGQDATPLASVTLEAYAARVVALLDAEPEPVVLVGHSMGGIVVSTAAEARPERVRCAVYLAAFLLQPGQSMLAMAQQDQDALILPNLDWAADGGSVSIRDEAAGEVFYGDCTAADVAWARARLRPQATAPGATPIAVTAARAGRVPRAYVVCARDRAVSPALQHAMLAATPCDTVVTMPTSHSPFLSAPDPLTGHLLDVAASGGGAGTTVDGRPA